jgi:inner membrane protein
MDTITHCITGAVIAKAGFSQRLGKIATFSSIAASFMPDADIFLRLFRIEDMSFFVKYHRGPGNSFFFMIPIAFTIALIFNRISGKKVLGRLFVLCVLAMLTHNFMDLQTSYGTMLLFPFSDKRFSLDLVFILDFFYSGILFVGLLGTIFWKGRAEWVARVTLVLIALYTGLCATNHSRALSAAREFAAANAIETIEVASLPQPLSPFLWTNLIKNHEFFYQGYLDLLGNNHRGYSDTLIGKYISKFKGLKEITYKPYARFPDTPLEKESLNLDGVKLFLWFARFPIFLPEEVKDGLHIVRLFDLRFHSLEGRYPFVYEVKFDRQGNIKSESFKDT